MIEVDGNLYIGLGNQPAGSDGAAISRVSPAGEIVVEHQLDEQGIHDMHLHDGKLYVAGTDPTDDWMLGNIYIRDIDTTWTKRRTLPLTIHTWGMCHDESGHLWTAVGAHAGDSQTWQGRVMRSSDDGLTWDTSIQLNDYRMMDIIEFGNTLYAIGLHWTGELYERQLWTSTNGIGWFLVSGVTPLVYQRLVKHDQYLYCLQHFGSTLLKINPDGNVETIELSERCTDLPLNTLASDGTNLYYLDRNGAIWNALSGVQISSIPGAISLGCWPSQNCLIASTAGAQAALWRVTI